MPRYYVLIENDGNGFLWAEADAADAEQACRLVDERLGVFGRSYCHLGTRDPKVSRVLDRHGVDGVPYQVHEAWDGATVTSIATAAELPCIGVVLAYGQYSVGQPVRGKPVHSWQQVRPRHVRRARDVACGINKPAPLALAA